MDIYKVTEQEVAILFRRGCGSDRIPRWRPWIDKDSFPSRKARNRGRAK